MSVLESHPNTLDRRELLKKVSAAVFATSAAALPARSYSRILGANDRIRLAQLGCGGRSQGHVHMVHMASRRTPLEVVAVCDIWSLARERRAAQVKDLFGTDPQTFKYSEQMLARNDIDGVMIATGDHQHAKLCIEVVQAGKDCYVEKPFANVLDEGKAARAAVKASKQVVQMGTQHRSQPYPLAVRDIIQSGRIGQVARITQEWNVNQPRWRHIPGIDDGTHPTLLKEEDTDWQRWLLGKPNRPFDPHVYLEFRLYRDFSAGIFDQWLSHGADLVHLWMDETHPVSATATGGILTWKDGRENPDNATVSFTYPKGFLYTYSTTFSNSYRSFSRIQGRDGTIENYGGEGASLFLITKEGGAHEFDPESNSGPRYTAPPGIGPAQDRAEIVRVPGAPQPDSLGPDDDDLGHLMNWLNAMRDRKQPNATVDHGFSHSIACIMAAQSYWSGKRLYWDRSSEEIVDHAV
ncbi:MAG: Gfo/Idh/MocA family oxidoreductase [Acidobacteriaceae bacterium]|nr:Gfo/Idh/MocA family oxidoreductase [Acidobacteriaceae bacterium]MBV9780323.1 Gfo/Idh/MocA family oxidoreductase [Acidobacteriaceae bacterium]